VEITTIQLRPSTRDLLREIGRKGETYDKILRRRIAASEYSEFLEEQYAILQNEKH
jgi:hypothetical protein